MFRENRYGEAIPFNLRAVRVVRGRKSATRARVPKRVTKRRAAAYWADDEGLATAKVTIPWAIVRDAHDSAWAGEWRTTEEHRVIHASCLAEGLKIRIGKTEDLIPWEIINEAHAARRWMLSVIPARKWHKPLGRNALLKMEKAKQAKSPVNLERGLKLIDTIADQLNSLKLKGRSNAD